jgi:hypothetical protein
VKKEGGVAEQQSLIVQHLIVFVLCFAGLPQTRAL